MIKLTRINGEEFVVNADLIQYVERRGDTFVTLTTQERARWEARRARRLLDGADGALTVQGLFDRIDALAESDLDERQQAVLGALYEWAEQIAPTPD